MDIALVALRGAHDGELGMGVRDNSQALLQASLICPFHFVFADILYLFSAPGGRWPVTSQWAAIDFDS